MNLTDNVTVHYRDSHYQAAVKCIDDFLMKYDRDFGNKRGSKFQVPAAAGKCPDADQLVEIEEAIGSINTLLMALEETTGINISADGVASVAHTSSYALSTTPEADIPKTPVMQKNVNEDIS